MLSGHTPRHPVQSRAHFTRSRIIAAAAKCLADKGYGATSTQAISSLAGCSQGALFKHFPTKCQLLAASIERIVAGFVWDFRSDLTRAGAEGLPLDLRIEAAVGALWSIFRNPGMQAVFEVYVAARTDATLGAALQPILDTHRANILAEARRWFPEAGESPALDPAVDAIVYAMQGVALGLFSPPGAVDAQHIAFFTRLARHELAAVASPEPR